MDYNAQLKLQAWLDGELPEAEAREVAAQVARDREGAALAEELRNTRQALAGFEADVRLPESREFYWSKIAREIQRLEAAPPKPAPQESPFALFRRWLVPASAVALVVIAGLAPHPAACLLQPPRGRGVRDRVGGRRGRVHLPRLLRRHDPGLALLPRRQ